MENQNQEVNLPDNESSHEADTAPKNKDEAGDAETITLTKDELEQRLKDRAKEQDKRWKDRLKNAGDDDGSNSHEKSKEKDGEKSVQGQEALMERLDRADLRAEGIKDKAQQDTVLELAKALGMNPVEALGRAAVQAELKALQDKAATPTPSGRSPQRNSDDVDYWVEQFKKGKEVPNLEMRRKVRNKLAGK